MRARAPLDVDLEDKLLYGLTPMRLVYLVVGLVSGFGLWSSPWAPSPLRAIACMIVVAVGAVAAWGRWHGRAVDSWLADLSLFVISTHRIVLDQSWLRPIMRRRPRPAPIQTPNRHVVIVVTGRAPKAGATTVATELATSLAMKGYPQELWTVRDAFMGHSSSPSPSEPLLSVAAVESGRVCYLDRGAGPYVAGVIPEDELVLRAMTLKLATVVAFPESAASKAFGDLVEVIAAAG
ncbi:MAG TPA: hypothetical protein VNU19_14185 [Candidatus Acidoferrum sp.]|jgi:hypothetical protein|nr:hypothetical protein [Candidatus Acidoferrum sp.]